MGLLMDEAKMNQESGEDSPPSEVEVQSVIRPLLLDDCDAVKEVSSDAMSAQRRKRTRGECSSYFQLKVLSTYWYARHGKYEYSTWYS
jgi:hypothetical protein